MSQILTLFLKTAAEQSPILLIYIVAIFLAVIFWERGPRPSGLVLIAILVLLVATIGQMFLFAYLASSSARAADAHAIPQLLWMQSAIAFAGSFLRAVGIAILLAAVWVGRKVQSV